MKRQVFYILFFIPLFMACLESPEMTIGIVNGKEKPTVVTLSGDSILDDGILLFQGEITSKGKDDNIERGFFWSTVSNNPSEGDNKVTISNAADVFTYQLKGASGEKTYYWRAYAQNSFGYDYGEVRSCPTPEIWIPKRELPTDSRGRGVIFMLADRIYMACGVKSWGSVPVDNTWEYSIASDQWNQADSITFIGSNRINPVVFTIGNFAFVGTGLNFQATACNDFYQFTANNLTKTWKQIITPNDFAARYEAVAFSLNEKGYVIGGYSADRRELKDMWQYDPDNDSWMQKNNFPVNLCGGICITGNNRAFAGFGENTDSERKLWEYDDATDSWNEFTTLPDNASRYIYSGVIIRNTIYIVDGDNKIWTLNLSDKTWEREIDLPPALLTEYGEGGNQTLLTTGNSNSIYVGLGFTKLLYEYRPLWDN